MPSFSCYAIRENCKHEGFVKRKNRHTVLSNLDLSEENAVTLTELTSQLALVLEMSLQHNYAPRILFLTQQKQAVDSFACVPQNF